MKNTPARPEEPLVPPSCVGDSIRLVEIEDGRFPFYPEEHAVIRAYLDDSSDPKRAKFISVGGLAAPVIRVNSVQMLDGWDALEFKWLSVTHELTAPFRSTDCETGHGQFEEWSIERRSQLMRDLVSVLTGTTVRGVAIIVPVQEYRETFPDAGEYDPYYLGVTYVMAALANYGDHEGQQSVKFSFEDSDATAGKTHALYKQLKSLRNWGAAKRLGGIGFYDKRLLALQAADLLAREAFKHFDNLETDRPMRKPLQRLLGNNRFCVFGVSPRALRVIRDDFGWPGDLLSLAKEAEIRGLNI